MTRLARAQRHLQAGRAAVWLVDLASVGALTLAASVDPSRLAELELIFWLLVIAATELLPVPARPRLRLSLSFPMLIAVAMLYEPAVAAVVVFLASFDVREVRGELPLMTALFNRCQFALGVLGASALFHQVATLGPQDKSSWGLLLGGGLLATATFYCTNLALVSFYLGVIHGHSPRRVLSEVRVGALSEFLLSYVGLGLIGIVIALLYLEIGIWAVLVFVLPWIFARQMFFRTMALEEAGKELKDRQQVLRALSNRMAEERQDERIQIAGYLHDDLAQMLFRLTLQLEMAKKRLMQGDLTGVSRDLDNITDIKQQTSEMVRALIRDLHRSPIGRAGLAEAMESFAEDMSRGSRTRIAADVAGVSLPPPIQLLIYQIAREAAMNALKHAEAENIWISLRETEHGIELTVRDDGKGFDTTAGPPEGHFGLVMMRERAQVAGGTFSLRTEVGRGTAITALFPRIWVEEGSRLEAGGDGAVDDGPKPVIPRPAPVGSTTGPARTDRLRLRWPPGRSKSTPSSREGETAAIGPSREETALPVSEEAPARRSSAARTAAQPPGPTPVRRATSGQDPKEPARQERPKPAIPA